MTSTCKYKRFTLCWNSRTNCGLRNLPLWRLSEGNFIHEFLFLTMTVFQKSNSDTRFLLRCSKSLPKSFHPFYVLLEDQVTINTSAAFNQQQLLGNCKCCWSIWLRNDSADTDTVTIAHALSVCTCRLVVTFRWHSTLFIFLGGGGGTFSIV